MPLLQSVFSVLLDIAPGSWAFAFLSPVLAVVILTVATGILIKILLRKQAAEKEKQSAPERRPEEQIPEDKDR